MQVGFKVCFWFSFVLALMGSGLGAMVGGYYEWYLIVAIFAVPGLFVKSRTYKAAALLIACAYLYFSYQDYLAGAQHEVQMIKATQKSENMNR